ncbi:hypothetical protein D3C76_1435050 [compost metagenome]
MNDFLHGPVFRSVGKAGLPAFQMAFQHDRQLDEQTVQSKEITGISFGIFTVSRPKPGAPLSAAILQVVRPRRFCGIFSE